MNNLETPVLKYALYGAHSSLGSALACELLSRQHEVVALLDDLNSVEARPGLRVKPGDPCDAASVGESVAGTDAVVLIFPRRPGEAEALSGFYATLDGLLAGLAQVQVHRLLLVADFTALERQPETAAALQRLAVNPLDWILVDTPPDGHDLTIEDFLEVHGDPRRQRLRQLASGIADELETPRHRHARIRFQV